MVFRKFLAIVVLLLGCAAQISAQNGSRMSNGAVVKTTSPYPAVPKGPDPYVDVTRYGVRAVSFTTGLKAACTSGTGNCTLSGSGYANLINGDGVTLVGAGAACSLSMPSAPTVTPSQASGATGLGLVVNAPSGSTSYAYEIVAVNKTRCYTVASSSGTTNTGSSSLGSQSATISSLSRSGTTVTVKTTGKVSIASGTMVYIGTGTSNDPAFSGIFQVTSGVTAGTSFTVATLQDTALNAAASATGGTASVYWMNCNHITWSVVSNAQLYLIYGRTGGSLNLIGVSFPTTAASGATTFWDDFGSTMSGNFTAPFWASTTPPVSAQPNELTTTISSGGGTSSIVLAANVMNASGVPIVFDNAPNITTAYAGASLLHFPFAASGCYLVNSFLPPPSSSISISVSGTICANDTIQGNSAKWFGAMLPPPGNAPQFAFEGEQAITFGAAYPGFLLDNGNSQTIRNISFISNLSNNAVVFFWDGGSGAAQVQCEWCTFESATSGSTDYMGMPVVIRGGFFSTWKNITVLSGPGQSQYGSTFTPAFATLGATGSILMENSSIQDRGMAIMPATPGVSYIFRRGRAQGLSSPWLLWHPNGGFTAGLRIIEGIELDTTFMPVVADIPVNNGVDGGSLYFNSNPADAYFVTGTKGPPIFNWQSVINNAINGQISPPYFSDDFVQTYGLGQVGYSLVATGTPSVSTSSGGTFPTGNYSAEYTVVDANGHESTPSTYTDFKVSGDNKTVTLNSPSAINGAVAWRPYFCNPNGASCTLASVSPCSGTVAIGTNFTQSVSSGCGNSPPATSTAAATGFSSNGLETYQIKLTGGSNTETLNGSFTENRTTTLPDVSGYVPVSSYQNSAYDNFNRANGTLGSKWSNDLGTIQNVSSDQLVGNGGNSVSHWSASSFAADQFAQITITGTFSTSQAVGVCVRASPSGGGNGYCWDVSRSTRTLFKWVNGGFAFIDSGSVSPVAGDVMRLEVQGTTLNAYYNGALIFTAADSSLTAGQPGVYTNSSDSSTSGDNWTGGNLHPLAHLDTEQDWTQVQHLRANGGTCTMSGGTTCTVTVRQPSSSDLTRCITTVQGTTVIAGACSISGQTVTVTAAGSNSATWAVFIF